MTPAPRAPRALHNPLAVGINPGMISFSLIARASVAVLCMAAWAASPLAAEDWPRFRGPTGQGVSTEKNLPLKWSATENVAWKIAVPGLGWSSPIVVGGRVFLTTATGTGESCHVICIDARNGSVLWDREVFKQAVRRKEGRNSYATPTPVSDGKMVYAVFAEGSMAALDFDGNVAWVNRDVRYYSQHGLAVSPILWEDLLIMQYDASAEEGDLRVGWQKPWDKSFVLAVDKTTGKARWRAMRGISRIGHITPNIMNVGGTAQLISAAGDVIQGFEPATGRLLWTVANPGEGVVPSIVIGEGLIFTASGFGSPAIRATRPGGPGQEAKIVWEQKEQVPMMSSYIYADGRLYTIKETGIAMCLEAATGNIIWKERIGGTHSASPILAEGRIYFLSDQGESVIIEAGPQFRTVATSTIGERCQASFAVSDGRLFIRSEKNLYCIGGR